jgi:molybdenum cofactor cytidylyltransferase
LYVYGVVLAAGASSRLGRPKQLLAYKETTLLDATLRAARACGFDQLVVTLGAAGEEIGARVDLSGIETAKNESFASGCASSIASALDKLDPRAEAMVLLLGDQPEISPFAVRRLIDKAARWPLGICRYDDGLGHPMWFRRETFSDLAGLHGDKAVWKLLESGRDRVLEVPTPGKVPLDVDTCADYEALLASSSTSRQLDKSPGAISQAAW